MSISPNLCFLSAILAAAAQSADMPGWPDPQRNPIVLVNANHDIAAYLRNHPDWFSSGELVLDLAVPRQSDDSAARRESAQIRESLQSKGLAAGTYTSGTTVEPLARIQQWPYDKVPTEWMLHGFAIAGSWPGDSDRKIIDVSDLPTRRALQAGIRRLWQQCDAPIRFVDNAASHSSTGGHQPWQDYCANIREIRLIAESLGCRAVFNVSVHPALLSDTEAKQLIAAVGRGNGILLEDPWSEATRKSPELTHEAQSRYRQLLGQGIAVIVLSTNVPTADLFAWVNSWRQPSDRIYLGWPFFRKPWEAPHGAN